jgi:hypothetical protein
MSATSKLIVHCGGVRRSREELATLDTPQGTRTWRPVPHAELVASLEEGLSSLGVHIAREEFCTLGRDDAKLLGSLDLQIAGLDSEDFSMGLGLRAGNDRKVAVQFVTACRVFVCDNWAFSGADGAVFLKRRHTRRLDIRVAVHAAVEQFLKRAASFRVDIDRMRGHRLTDAEAKTIVHDAFASGILPVRLFHPVDRLYFRDEVQRARFPDRSARSLNNAMTEAIKALRPAPQQHAGLRIGRLFGGIVNRVRPEPIAVIDGIEVFN